MALTNEDMVLLNPLTLRNLPTPRRSSRTWEEEEDKKRRGRRRKKRRRKKRKRTLAALTKPPKSPPKTKYEHVTEKAYLEAERSGSTVSDQRLKERRAGKKLPSSANKRTNHAPRSRCLATSSLMIRRWCPVIAILEITCPTMYIMKSWRWTNTNTITRSLSSKMKNL